MTRGDQPLWRKLVPAVGLSATILVAGVIASFRAEQSDPRVVIVLGLIVSSMLSALVFILATGRSNARVKVDVVTAELDASEHELQQQAEMLQAVMNVLDDGVGVVDGNGQFLQHNPAAKWLLGIQNDLGNADSTQEPYGMFRADGITPFPPDELPLVRALANEPCDGVEMVIRNAARPDGVLISVSGRPLDPSGRVRGAIAVFHDITALRRQQDELESFAGIVAHDLKSPLTSIGGNIELTSDLLEEIDGPEAAQALVRLRRMSNGVSRMVALIDDLLLYTKAGEGTVDPSDCDLSEITKDVVRSRMEYAEVMNGAACLPRITVDPMPVVRADHVLIRQVIDNLVGNSIKYTVPGEAAQIRVSASRQSDGWTRVEVADSGIGIPPVSTLLCSSTFIVLIVRPVTQVPAWVWRSVNESSNATVGRSAHETTKVAEVCSGLRCRSPALLASRKRAPM